MSDTKDRFSGCIYGLAIGDAIGFPVEFLKLEQIKERFGPEGISALQQFHDYPFGAYSDDTQMTIAVANGLLESNNPDDLEDVMKHIADEFIEWCNSPENNRAPGETCCIGCENLERGGHWTESGVRDSKGCGAAMRSAPIGLFYNDVNKVVEVAAAVSACTHAHPTGIASGIATAVLVHLAIRGYEPFDMPDKVCELTGKYDTKSELLQKMLQVREVLDEEPEQAIPKLGQGWTGEEAVAIAVYSFLKSPSDYRKTVLAAANITGDSDSTACIAGAISGAYNGLRAIPEKWIREVENSGMLGKLAEKLYEKHRISKNKH
jgi:ADP-ribosylglycohydrolase